MTDEIPIRMKIKYAKVYLKYQEYIYFHGCENDYATKREIRNYLSLRSEFGKEISNIIEDELNNCMIQVAKTGKYKPEKFHKACYQAYIKYLRKAEEENLLKEQENEKGAK